LLYSGGKKHGKNGKKSEKRLKRMIPALYGVHDILLIDCHPTYDNIVLNALHAADYVITPVLQDLATTRRSLTRAKTIIRNCSALRTHSYRPGHLQSVPDTAEDVIFWG
jgi:cellulose biosynthesis protein BcsQ